MRILIAGGAGLIGSNLARKLLARGNKVIVVDNFMTSTRENLGSLTRSRNFTFIEHDITLPLKRLPTIDQIYHLACPTGVPNLERLAEEMLLVNSLGTHNMLELARGTGAPLLFTSSCEIYGDPLVSPQTEEYAGNVDPLGPRSAYEEGKRFSETLLKMYANKHNVDGKIVRLFNVYGPGSSPGESRVIPSLLRQALAGEPLTVHGDGRQKRTFSYVDDITDGIVLVLERGTAGEAYNLGSDEQLTISDVAKIIMKVSNSKSKIQFVPRPSHDHQERLPSLTKVKKLGWEAKTPFEVGLKKTLESLKLKVNHNKTAGF